MKRTISLLLCLATLLSLCACSSGLVAEETTSEEKTEEKPEELPETEEISETAEVSEEISETEEQVPEIIEKTFKISGMMCGHCEAHVKETLEAIPEITEATASCLHDNAVVKMTSEVPKETIREAIEKAGYHLE